MRILCAAGIAASPSEKNKVPATVPEAHVARQRAVVEAFIAASRGGDFEGLLALLDPDVVLHVDPVAVAAGAPNEIHGAEAVAGQARTFASRARFARPALINGAVGAVVAPRGRLQLVQMFTVVGRKVVELEVIIDPERLDQLELAVLDL